MQVSRDELVRLGELQTVEFKTSLGLTKDALEALCGMLNTDLGIGTIWFGVEPDGSIRGIEPGNLDSAQQSLSRTVREKFDPRIIHSIERYECEGKILICLSAERTTGVAYHEFDGRAYIREGSTRRKLTIAERDHLKRRRNRETHPGPWKCDKCGAVIGMFSGMVVTDHGVERTFSHGCGGELWPAS